MSLNSYKYEEYYMPGLMPVVCLLRRHVQCLVEIIIVSAEEDYSASAQRLLVRGCKQSVILWLQFSSGRFLSSPPLEQVRWSERWPAAGLPPGRTHCHLLELQPCVPWEGLLGSLRSQCALQPLHLFCFGLLILTAKEQTLNTSF